MQIDVGEQWDGRQTAPVASFPANGWGLYDMHANVSEWVEDCWDDEASGTDCATRVLRGGSWGSIQVFTRCADRSRFNPLHRNANIGFRVVCSSPIRDR